MMGSDCLLQSVLRDFALSCLVICHFLYRLYFSGETHSDNEANKIHHWCSVGSGKSLPEGPYEACRISH